MRAPGLLSLTHEGDYTVVEAKDQHNVYKDYEDINSGRAYDEDLAIRKALREHYNELNLTVTVAGNVPLLAFAANGHASAELDIEDECIRRFRSYVPGDKRRGVPDRLGEGRTFAKYNFRWGNEYFILYTLAMGFNTYQYILKEPGQGETVLSTNSVTDDLVGNVGKWAFPDDDKYIYVYDGYWAKSKALYNEIQKASWKDVILNEGMKKTLTELMHKFFDSGEVYKDLGVPWKRGVIFHGPAGNGKTISIKALMHSLFQRQGFAIPSLYVKSASSTYSIRNVFTMARAMSPCLLIFEDIDTIVTPRTRSYFFNEVDGLENNDGLFMVASTNHLDQLDPGLSSRPSRFDRKYLFLLPDLDERILYCEYWRKKLADKPSIQFPQKLCPAIAGITDDFSFAYLKEAFVATLLVIAGNRSEDADTTGGGDDLDEYELWREIKNQVRLLRDEMQANAEPNCLRRLCHVQGQHPENLIVSGRPRWTGPSNEERGNSLCFEPAAQMHFVDAKTGTTSASWDECDPARANTDDVSCVRPFEARTTALPIRSAGHDWKSVVPAASTQNREARQAFTHTFTMELGDEPSSTAVELQQGRTDSIAK